MKKASRIFGAENDKLSEYQKKVDDASYEICKQKPSLLFGKKGDIVTMAREKVHSDGYVYKKGSSCSKKQSTGQVDDFLLSSQNGEEPQHISDSVDQPTEFAKALTFKKILHTRTDPSICQEAMNSCFSLA